MIRSLFLILSCLVMMVQGFTQEKISYSELISLKKGFKVHPFPNSFKKRIPGFTVMEPGLTIIPLNGGLFIPGFGSWLLPPDTSYPVFASSFLLDKHDTAFVLVKLDRKRQKMIIQKTSHLGKANVESGLFNMPVSTYDLLVSGANNFFLWGRINGGSALWKSDFTSVTSLFYSSSIIMDMDFINENNLLLAVDSSIVGIGMKKSPEVLIKLDLPVESVCIDKVNGGALYISTAAGIVRFNSLDRDDVDVITNRIHGRIRIYQDKLFVLWGEKNQIVEIKLK